MARLAQLGICFIAVIATANAQSVRLYSSGWLTSVSGQLYYIESEDGHYIYSAYGAQLRRASDSKTTFPVASAWPVGTDMATVEPLLNVPEFIVRRFSDGRVLFNTKDEPIAMSRDGKTLVTTPDKVILHIKRGARIQTIKLKAHVIGVSLSNDGKMGVITLQNGSMGTFTTDKKGVVHLRNSKLKYGSPGYGLDWHGTTVAIFGSETNSPDGLACMWLCNVRTGALKNLGSSTVAVTATNQGFLSLNDAGRLALLNDSGKVIKNYGILAGLKGYYYERGPKAYDYLPLIKGRLAGGQATSLAFDRDWLYALDQFGKFKQAPAPWRGSVSQFTSLAKYP